jgi:hypothetical protein
MQKRYGSHSQFAFGNGSHAGNAGAALSLRSRFTVSQAASDDELSIVCIAEQLLT